MPSASPLRNVSPARLSLEFPSTVLGRKIERPQTPSIDSEAAFDELVSAGRRVGARRWRRCLNEHFLRTEASEDFRDEDVGEQRPFFQAGMRFSTFGLPEVEDESSISDPEPGVQVKPEKPRARIGAPRRGATKVAGRPEQMLSRLDSASRSMLLRFTESDYGHAIVQEAEESLRAYMRQALPNQGEATGWAIAEEEEEANVIDTDEWILVDPVASLPAASPLPLPVTPTSRLSSGPLIPRGRKGRKGRRTVSGARTSSKCCGSSCTPAGSAIRRPDDPCCTLPRTAASATRQVQHAVCRFYLLRSWSVRPPSSLDPEERVVVAQITAPRSDTDDTAASERWKGLEAASRVSLCKALHAIKRVHGEGGGATSETV